MSLIAPFQDNLGIGGNTTLVTAVAGEHVIVYGFWITSSIGAQVSFTDGTGGSNLGGSPFNVAAGIPCFLEFISQPELFRTSDGKALVLHVVLAADIGGYIVYDQSA
jgi:hypothetical protein